MNSLWRRSHKSSAVFNSWKIINTTRLILKFLEKTWLANVYVHTMLSNKKLNTNFNIHSKCFIYTSFLEIVVFWYVNSDKDIFLSLSKSNMEQAKKINLKIYNKYTYYHGYSIQPSYTNFNLIDKYLPTTASSTNTDNTLIYKTEL